MIMLTLQSTKSGQSTAGPEKAILQSLPRTLDQALKSVLQNNSTVKYSRDDRRRALQPLEKITEAGNAGKK